MIHIYKHTYIYINIHIYIYINIHIYIYTNIHFRCSKCEASPRYSINAIQSVLKNNMFFELIYDLKALYMIMHFGRSKMF